MQVQGETWVRFLVDEELFGVLKAAVWRTRKQAKKFLEKKKKEKEVGEEGEGDKEDEDTDTEDRDKSGDGGDQGDGPGAVEGALGANWDEGMGVAVDGVDGEGVECDGMVVGGVSG